MMDCNDIQHYVDTYLDSELSPELETLVDAHLVECSSCPAYISHEKELRLRIKIELAQLRAPDRLRQEVLAIFSEQSSATLPTLWGSDKSDEGYTARHSSARQSGRHDHRRIGWRFHRGWSAFAAVAAVFLLIGGFKAHETDWLDDLVDQAGVLSIFEDVVKIHSRDLPSEVSDSNAAQVSSWFRGKVEFPVRPIEFREVDAKLVGARLSNVREYNAAVLYYNVNGHRVTVTVFASPKKSVHKGARRFKNRNGRELFYRNVKGYVVPVVQDRGITYALTGDLDPQTQLKLASRARIVY